MKGADQSPPRGTQATTGRGRERELRERDGSHKRSRNYSRKLRERTPLHGDVSSSVLLLKKPYKISFPRKMANVKKMFARDSTR